jgi:hypothetical protein
LRRHRNNLMTSERIQNLLNEIIEDTKKEISEIRKAI